jgi:hypothetical protein
MKMIVQSQKGACLCSWLCTSKYSKTANYSWLKTRQAKANQNQNNNNNNNNNKTTLGSRVLYRRRVIYSTFSFLTLFPSLNRLVMGI